MSLCMFSCVVCYVERCAMSYCDACEWLVYALLLCMFFCAASYVEKYGMMLICGVCDVAAVCGM